MVLRLVLVSIVAGLGLSPPAESELAGWTCAVRTWLDARRVEWDAQAPRGECERAVAPVAEAPATDLGLDALIGELTAELSKAPASGVPPRIKDTSAPADGAFEAVVEEMVAAFSRAEADAPALVEKMPVPADDVATEQPDEFEGELADDTPWAEAPEPTAQYEPINVGDDLYPGLAYALNREAEGIGEPNPTPLPATSAGNQLSNAVRLTRDAVYAWMNLIQSPAIVTIPR